MLSPVLKVTGGICLLISALITVSCTASAEHYIEIGNKNYAAGNYADAALNYRKAIQKNQNSGEAYYGLGRADYARNDFQNAYNALQRATELLPKRIDVKSSLADLLLGIYERDTANAGLYNALSKLTKEMLALNPDSYDGLRMRGNLALFDRKPEEAVQAFQRANEIKPFQDYLIVGYTRALFDNGRGPEGIQLARQLIERKKDFGPIYDVLFQYYAGSGDRSSAEQILREKIRNNPINSGALIQLADYYRQTQNSAAVQSTIDELLQSYGTRKDAYLLTGDFYAHYAEWDNAAATYEKGIQLQPAQVGSLRKRLAFVRVAQGRRPEAMEILDQVLAKTPNDQDAEISKADLLLQRNDTGDLDKGIAIYEAVLKVRPNAQAALMGVGKAYFAKGNLESARKSLRLAAQGDSTAEDPRLMLASISLTEGKPADAVVILDELLSAVPTSARGRYLKINSLMMLGRYDEARPDLEKLSRDFPGNNDLSLLRGLLAIVSKRYAEAETIFSTSGSGGSDFRFAGGLAEAYVDRQEFDKAIDLLEAAVRKEPKQFAIRQILAQTYLRAGKYDRAITEFQTLLQKDPNSITLLNFLGQAYQAKGDLTNATQILQKSAQLQPQDPRAYFLLGYTMNETGNQPEAISNYRRALAIQPTNSLVMNNLAYALAETGNPRDLDDALRYSQKALEVSPNEPDFKDTLGWIWLKRGKANEALQLFTDITHKVPANASYRHHLGLALLADGNSTAAHATLEAALASNPSQNEAVEIRNDLKRTATGGH